MLIPNDLDRRESELSELDADVVKNTEYRILHDVAPTGSWFFVTDDRVLMGRSKVMSNWKSDANMYAAGYIDGENQS